MSGVTKEQIEEARAVDLLDYIQSHEPGVLKREGPGIYRHKEHDSLVYCRKYWYWNSRGRAINALDYLMEIRGYDFVGAVEALVGKNIRDISPRTVTARSRPEPEKKKPFKLPWAKRCAISMLSYLQSRGIDSDIILRCMQNGSLYESKYYEEAVCVFVGRDDKGIERFACMRSVSGSLRKDISGSDKRFSFCYPPEQLGSRHLAVFEAPIDALSHATLQKLEGWKWNGYRLSLGGTSAVALTAFLERHPEIIRVALYLDNDLAGRTNARKIKALLNRDPRFSHIRVSINPPSTGKDYNDKLLHTIQKIREEKQTDRQKQAVVSI